jgi:hypothetical protein
VSERWDVGPRIAILGMGLLLGCEPRSESAGVNPEGATTSASAGKSAGPEAAAAPDVAVYAPKLDGDARDGGSDGARTTSGGPSSTHPAASLRARLPALRDDHAVVAALWTTDNGLRGETSIEMQIIDVGADRIVDSFQVSGPFLAKPRHPVGEAAARAYLEERRWLPLAPMTIDEDRGAPVHKTDLLSEGAQARANKASFPGVTLRYREPAASVEAGTSGVRRAVPRWSGKAATPACPPPWASIGGAWVDAEAGVAVVEVTYRGFESDVCWLPDSTMHVLRWR